jgi:hypothetical protein
MLSTPLLALLARMQPGDILVARQNEQERDAVEGAIESFRRTWCRVKWDIAQQ